VCNHFLVPGRFQDFPRRTKWTLCGAPLIKSLLYKAFGEGVPTQHAVLRADNRPDELLEGPIGCWSCLSPDILQSGSGIIEETPQNGQHLQYMFVGSTYLHAGGKAQCRVGGILSPNQTQNIYHICTYLSDNAMQYNHIGYRGYADSLTNISFRPYLWDGTFPEAWLFNLTYIKGYAHTLLSHGRSVLASASHPSKMCQLLTHACFVGPLARVISPRISLQGDHSTEGRPAF